TLQSLRKFKVFITLASQYLTQYRKDIQDAITQTCETIISFRVGEDTARVLEKFYPKTFGYQTLMNLPRQLFFVSTPFQGNREYQVLETLDYKTGSSDPEEVIRHSLERYGRKVDVDELMGQVKTKSLQRDFLDWPVTPAEWTILLTVRLLGGYVDEDTLREHLLYNPATPKPYVLTEMGFVNALKNLAVDNAKRNAYLSFKDETTRKYREETYAYGKKELRAKEVRTRIWRLDLSDKKAKRLLDVTFRGEKAGGVKHIQAIMAQRKVYWLNGWIVRIDDGETDESIADLYVTPTLPASKVEGAKGYIDHTSWDYKRSFAVEVECYPKRHWDRLKDNYQRNKKMGFPTVFIVPNQADEETLKEKLLEWKATLVTNVTKFEPDHPEMVTIEIAETLNNQQTSNPKHNQTYEVEPTNQSSEYSSEQTDKLPEDAKLQETLDVATDTHTREGLQNVELLLEFADQGWGFRIKTSRDKPYLCARKGPKEKCLGLFNNEMRKIVEKNNIDVKGYNTKNQDTP
ncbi:MAG: hypothetical protein FWC33_01905, partial [Candidatus Bathyarchaeota archaeon]|nr:hypothetical protein [Candidatus Termiticorpusculum sp.]